MAQYEPDAILHCKFHVRIKKHLHCGKLNSLVSCWIK